jgi:hypothetical protein
MFRTRRHLARSAGIVALASAGLFLGVQSAAAYTSPKLWALNNDGYARYKSETNHGWVCDSYSDGIQVYAVWEFGGGLGTTYRANAPAHLDGCADNFFDKVPDAVEVCVNLNNLPDPCTYTIF